MKGYEMAKVTKQTYSLIDSKGYEWVRGEFTNAQVIKWIKSYQKINVYLSTRIISDKVAA